MGGALVISLLTLGVSKSSWPSLASPRRACCCVTAIRPAPPMQLLALRGGSSGVTADSGSAKIVLGLVCLGSLFFLAYLIRVFLSVTRAPTLSESGMRSRRWNELRDELWVAQVSDRLADGAAESHASAAREEAARKLIMSRERVLHDITRPDGPPRTQPNLVRLPGRERDVDAVLLEVARRLLGRLAGERVRRLKPTSKEQAATWTATAEYLMIRIQSTAEEVHHTVGHEQRAPDMSEEAAAALRAVLSEVASEEVASPGFFNGLFVALA